MIANKKLVARPLSSGLLLAAILAAAGVPQARATMPGGCYPPSNPQCQALIRAQQAEAEREREREKAQRRRVEEQERREQQALRAQQEQHQAAQRNQQRQAADRNGPIAQNGRFEWNNRRYEGNSVSIESIISPSDSKCLSLQFLNKTSRSISVNVSYLLREWVNGFQIDNPKYQIADLGPGQRQVYDANFAPGCHPGSLLAITEVAVTGR